MVRVRCVNSPAEEALRRVMCNLVEPQPWRLSDKVVASMILGTQEHQRDELLPPGAR